MCVERSKQQAQHAFDALSSRHRQREEDGFADADGGRAQRERLEVKNFAHDIVSFNEDDVTPVMDAETHDMAKLDDYPTDDKQPKEIVNGELNDFDDNEQEEVKIKFEDEGEE